MFGIFAPLSLPSCSSPPPPRSASGNQNCIFQNSSGSTQPIFTSKRPLFAKSSEHDCLGVLLPLAIQLHRQVTRGFQKAALQVKNLLGVPGCPTVSAQRFLLVTLPATCPSQGTTFPKHMPSFLFYFHVFVWTRHGCSDIEMHPCLVHPLEFLLAFLPPLLKLSVALPAVSKVSSHWSLRQLLITQ